MVSPSVGIRQIQAALKTRSNSDVLVSTAWIILPIMSIIFVTTALVTVLVFYPGMSEFVTPLGIDLYFLSHMPQWAQVLILLSQLMVLIFLVILSYKLIKRRNLHFYRSALLRSGIIRFVRDKAVGKAYLELTAMESAHEQINLSETDRSPFLWTMLLALYPTSALFFPVLLNLLITPLGIIGLIAMLYVLYFLTTFSHENSSRDKTFMEYTKSALSKTGITVDVPVGIRSKKHPFTLYLIPSIVTIGLFGIYWFYVLIKDPNEHFKAQWAFEDSLVAKIS